MVTIQMFIAELVRRTIKNRKVVDVHRMTNDARCEFPGYAFSTVAKMVSVAVVNANNSAAWQRKLA